MIVTTVRLFCDQAECGRSVPEGAEARLMVRTIRRRALAAGWLRVGSRDYCPAHAVELVTAVRALAGAGRSDPQIAEALGVTVSAVCWVRHDNDIPAALGRPRVGAR